MIYWEQNPQDHHFLCPSTCSQNIRNKTEVSPPPIKTTMLMELSEEVQIPSDGAFSSIKLEQKHLIQHTWLQKIRFDFFPTGNSLDKGLCEKENCKLNLVGRKFLCQTRKYIPENSQLLLFLLLDSKNKETLQTCRKKFQSSTAFPRSLRKEGKDVKLRFMFSLIGSLQQTLTKLFILWP